MRQGRRSASPDCFVCRQLAGSEKPLPGRLVYEGSHFVVGHGPLETSTAGTLLVESRRHFLDYGEILPAESRELAQILKMLFPAMKAAARADRIYAFAMMDGAPHFHLWLVPRPRRARAHGVRFLVSHRRTVGTKADAALRQIRRALSRGGR